MPEKVKKPAYPTTNLLQNMHTTNNFANTFAKSFVHTIVKKQA